MTITVFRSNAEPTTLRQPALTKRHWVPIALTLSLGLSACASDDPNRRAKIGAGIGAIAGVIIGNQIGDEKARILGGTIGALAGAAVGNYQDNQQRALEEALAKEQRDKQIKIERLQDDVLRVSLSDQASFDINSAALKPAFKPSLDKIANQMVSFDKTVLHIIGYTDDTGSDAYNQTLSEKRADSVANYLLGDGVNASRLQTEGRGESSPRVPNSNAANRALNRRVEIYIQPIVEGREQDALTPPV